MYNYKDEIIDAINTYITSNDIDVNLINYHELYHELYYNDDITGYPSMEYYTYTDVSERIYTNLELVNIVATDYNLSMSDLLNTYPENKIDVLIRCRLLHECLNDYLENY